MKIMWRVLEKLPPNLLSFIKRHTNSNVRFMLRQHLGAKWEDIPDQIYTVPDGRRFHIGPDAIYWAIYYGVGFEPEITELVRKLVDEGNTVLDIGANFGWFTTLLSENVSDGGHVYAFEPIPTTYERLIENLKLNGLENRVTVERTAVSDAPGNVEIHIFKGLSHSCASLSTLNMKETDYHTIETSTIRLDQYLRDHNIEQIDFIKCDVEGSELRVLRGCGHFLEAPNAPMILIELNEETTQASGFEIADIWDHFTSVGYDHFFAIMSEHQLHRLTNDEFKELGKMGVSYSKFVPNMALCTKAHHISKLRSKNIDIDL